MQKPDSRVFASYPMPAKIDLLNERPRRESLVERQLENRIGQISPMVNDFDAGTSENKIITTTSNTTNLSSNWGRASPMGNGVSSVSPNTEIIETRIVINQHSSPAGHCHGESPAMIKLHNQGSESFVQQQHQERQQYVENQQQQQQQRQPMNQSNSSNTTKTTTTTTTTTTVDNKTILANELAQKEAKLMREIETLSQRPHSPYGQTPGKIDLMIANEQQQQQQQQRVNSPMQQQQQQARPHSSASSTTGQDLLEKEAKLLREIEEIESKPFNPQTMIVEREQWFEYPQNRPSEKHLTESRRRVRDFCSMPSGLCEERHIHEENIPIKSRPSPTPSSMHTAIIRSPRREIDNKSPLPFAFDNFSTKGVRGNIASVGAVEPDRPRPPIYPIVKRTPSPGFY